MRHVLQQLTVAPRSKPGIVGRSDKMNPKQKGQLLGEILVAGIPRMADSILRVVREKSVFVGDGTGSDQFLLELLVFHFHIIDRMAFDRLDPESRSAVLDAVFAMVLAWAIGQDTAFAAEFHKLCAKRQEEYAAYQQWFVEPKQSCAGTLFYEAGKILTQSVGGSPEDPRDYLPFGVTLLSFTLALIRELDFAGILERPDDD
jgi:hypothetical protein